MKTFTCFGEVLWDVFEDQEKIGGAPLNVALRLKSFKEHVAIISAIGDDELGKRLINYLEEHHLSQDYIQINSSYATGKVIVTLDHSGSATYDIDFPAAWDHITLDQASIDLVKSSKVFVFGSLVCRNATSKHTLLELLNYASFKVFDVNLRPPFYSFELLSELMHEANFIKFNDEELEEITQHFDSGSSSLEDSMSFISKTFNADFVCVTRGGEGAVLLNNGTFYYNSGYSVKVKDTVGAGDSFLATILYNITNNLGPQESLNRACAIGSIVASSEGANPPISESDILKMIENKK